MALHHTTAGIGSFTTARKWYEEHYGLSCDIVKDSQYLSKNEMWCYEVTYRVYKIYVRSSKELFMFQMTFPQETSE